MFGETAAIAGGGVLSRQMGPDIPAEQNHPRHKQRKRKCLQVNSEVEKLHPSEKVELALASISSLLPLAMKLVWGSDRNGMRPNFYSNIDSYPQEKIVCAL